MELCRAGLSDREIGDRLFLSRATIHYWRKKHSLPSNSEQWSINLDVCALPENAKCAAYYTPEMDGLSQPWYGRCWCNPSYGRQVGRWVEKAVRSALEGATVVMLLPARTDTQWFHRWIYRRAEIRFLPGRLKFGGAKNSAPFPSMLVAFGKDWWKIWKAKLD